MKVVFLDGEKIASMDELHAVFAAALDLPEYYGKNLDALHDCLTDMPDDVGVIAVNVEALASHLGRRWKGFLRLMRELPEEKPNFRFLLDPFTA